MPKKKNTKKSTRRDITETELEILDALWVRERAEIRELVEDVYGKHSQALHATVKSLLNRLIDKGMVECERGRFVHTYVPLVDRESFVGSQLERLAKSHFEGSFTPMLLSLIDKIKLSRKDRETLRNIVENIQE